MNWINKTLKDWSDGKGPNARYQGRPTTLKGLLNMARFNKYDPTLTAEQMGLTQEERELLANQYENSWFSSFNGWTSPRGQVFLTDKAFNEQPVLARDLTGIIVHELFHVAGYLDPHVGSLNKQIKQHCSRTSGSIGSDP